MKKIPVVNSERVKFKYLHDPKSTLLMLNDLECVYRDMAYIMDNDNRLLDFDWYFSLSSLCKEIKDILFPKNRLMLPHADADSLHNIFIKLQEKHIGVNDHLATLCSELHNRFLTAEIN